MSGSITISEQAEQMIANYIHHLSLQKKLSSKTLKEYKSDLKHFIGWFEAADQFKEVTVFRIEAVVTSTLVNYREAMQKTMALKPSTINRRLITLKQFFEWATTEAHVNHDPTKLIKLVPEQKSNPRRMTDQEEMLLIEASKQYGTLRDQTIIFTMLHTGLRPTEICNLTPDDIQLNPDNSYLIVRSLIRNKTREVPLNADCKNVIDKYIRTLSSDSVYLFASEKTGSRLTDRALRYLVQKYMKSAQIEGLRAHDLRHRFGYTMATKTELQHLAQIMGHENPNTTMIYVKNGHS